MLLAKADSEPGVGHGDGHDVMALACADCGCRHRCARIRDIQHIERVSVTEFSVQPAIRDRRSGLIGCASIIVVAVRRSRDVSITYLTRRPGSNRPPEAKGVSRSWRAAEPCAMLTDCRTLGSPVIEHLGGRGPPAAGQEAHIFVMLRGAMAEFLRKIQNS